MSGAIPGRFSEVRLKGQPNHSTGDEGRENLLSLHPIPFAMSARVRAGGEVRQVELLPFRPRPLQLLAGAHPSMASCVPIWPDPWRTYIYGTNW
jgi:hypothetical protein